MVLQRSLVSRAAEALILTVFKITNALEAVPADAQIIYAEGFPANKDLYDEKLAAEALQAAKAADKVVIFAGLPDSF